MYPNGVAVTYALDAAGNRTSVTTTQPPAAPGAPTTAALTGSSATLVWTAPGTGTTPAGYEYSLGSAPWTSTGTALQASLSGLTAGTQYTFAVRAYDALGARGPQSSATFSTPLAPPGAVTIGNIAGTTARASWGSSAGVAGYEYSLNGGGWTNSQGLLYANLSGLSYATQYTFSVRAYNAGGSRSGTSSATFTTATKPPPSTPTGLSATVAGNNQVNLSWNASSDSGGPGIGGYAIYRNGTEIGTTASTSYADTGVTPFNSYTYTVAAYDTQGTASPQSSAASASTFYQITNSVGGVISPAPYIVSVYIKARGENTWVLTQNYGSHTAVVLIGPSGQSSPGICEYGSTESIVAGYSRNGCIIYAEPSVYGH